MWFKRGVRQMALVALVLSPACGSRETSGDETLRVPSREIFLLPSGYRGPFIAIYEQRDGTHPAWRETTAVYGVPSTGIVRIALPEPPSSTKVRHAFVDRPESTLQRYGTCADMRVHHRDKAPAICWLDYQVGGTGVPGHIVALVSEWSDIPRHYNRAGYLLDSLKFGKWSSRSSPWEEPSDLNRRPTAAQQ